MVSSQTLFDTFVNFDIKYAGLIPEIPLDMDPTGRTDLLKVLDQGKKDGYIQANVPSIPFEPDAVLGLNAYSIRITSKADEETLLCAPAHMLASVGFLKDDGLHILGIKIGEVGGNKDISDLAVLYCPSADLAEMVCNLLGQCFQLVFSEATMQFFDKKIVEGAETNIFSETGSAGSSARTYETEGPSFISGSHTDLNRVQPSRPAHHSSTTLSDSDRVSSHAADLIQEYMRILHATLTTEELRSMAILLKRWRAENLPLAEFLQKVLELYGTERKYLLARMRPFIPEKEVPFFESFLEQSGVSDNAESSITSYSPGAESIYSRLLETSGDFNSLRLMMTPPAPILPQAVESTRSTLITTDHQSITADHHSPIQRPPRLQRISRLANAANIEMNELLTAEDNGASSSTNRGATMLPGGVPDIIIEDRL